MTVLAVHRPNRDEELTRLFRKAVTYSLVLHFSVLGVFGLLGHFRFHPRLDERSLRVSFMPGRSGTGRKPPRGSGTIPRPHPPREAKPAKPPEAVPQPEPKPGPQPESEKKTIAANKAGAEKTPTIKKPATKPDETKPAEGLPDGKREDIAAAEAAVHGQPGVADGSTEWSDAMDGIAGDSVMMAYSLAVGMAWPGPPITVPPDPGLYVDVIMSVDEVGNVWAYKITHLSGNADLDRSVKSFFDRLKKVPPPPRAVPGGYVELPLRFVPGDPAGN